MLLKSLLNEKKLGAALILCAILLTIISWAWHSRLGYGQRIYFGDHREGLFSESDPIINDIPSGPQSRWAFEGQQGQQISLSAESYEFDIYLLLLDPLKRQVAWSDNNGAFFNARILATLSMAGQYTVVVCGANADQFGVYWVSLEEGNHEVDWSREAVESYYQQGIDWCERAGSRRGESWLKLRMAQYFRDRRQSDEAEKYYADSLDRAKQCNFVYGQWAVALDHCRLLTRRRRNGPAVTQLEAALELSKKLKSAKQAETRIFIEFGNLYYSTARLDLARIYFRAVEKQGEQTILPSILVELYTSLNGILQVQDKEKAIEYAERAYSLSGGVDPVLELKAIHVMAGTYLFLKPGRSNDGSALAAAMREKARRLGCLDEEAAATTLMSMAKYLTNNIDEMIHLAGQALDLTNPADENPNPRRIALQLQADGEMLKGNHTAALKSCLETLQAVETAWAKESIEEMRQELLSQANAICTQIIRNLYPLNASHPSVEYAREAFDYAERSRSRSLLQQLITAHAGTDVKASPRVLSRDQESLARLSAVRGQLVMLRSSDSPSRERLYSLQEERAGLIAERMRFQAEIQQFTENRFYAAQLSPLTAEQAQQKLGESQPGSVILCYQMGIQDSFLIVLTPRGVHLLKLPDRVTVSKAVAEWRAQISNQLSTSRPTPEALHAYSKVAFRLYNMLMKPAINLIRGHDLIIVPSDSLHDLAFESLVVSEPKTVRRSGRYRYLLEEHAVTYVPSASVLSEIENRQQYTRPDKSMLLVCDAADDSTQAATTEDSRQPAYSLNRLPAARQEVLDIARLAKQRGINPTLWLGPEANEDKFTHSDLSVFRFIHLATHGVSDNQDGDNSALKLFSDPTGKEDGVLTGAEIARLKLTTDLLVLSGCETNIGQKAGAEGVVGLSRTFLVAGARCVCGSLWRVDDFWTQKLMDAFYERLLAGKLNKSRSLRLAKLKLLNRGASPSQWAAFVLVGSLR